jgi:hypothetical protein
MNHNIQTGTILIAEGTHVPASIQTENKAYVQGWQVASRLDHSGLLQTIRLTGWKLFSFDATYERWVFGFDDNKAIREAIRRIVATIRPKSFNCLEIKQVETRRCFGLPYVLVAAHSWHIQAGSALDSVVL